MKTLLPHGRSGPAWALLAATVAPLSAGCTSSDDGVRPAASCAYVVEYDNRRYMGRGETDVPVAESLGEATRPGCDDTPGDGDDGTGPTLMTAYAVKGVHPGVAIAVAEDSGQYRLAVVDTAEQLPAELRKLLERG